MIHQKLLKNDEYENEYVSFLTFLNNQKDFFYTKVYIYSGEFEDTIIEINKYYGDNINSFLDSNVIIGYIFCLDSCFDISNEFIFKNIFKW